MARQDEFRIFYNQTIHPELVRMDRKRRHLLRWIILSILLIIFLLIVVLVLELPAIALLSVIPIALYGSYMSYEVYKFKNTFKPNVVRLVLDFIDNQVNYGTLTYEPRGFIAKEEFWNSQLFITAAPVYKGEDFVKGSIGELPFEWCELWVQELSPVRSRVETVFKGVFFHATFFKNKWRDDNGTYISGEQLEGAVLILPRDQKPYLSRTIRQFVSQGGKNIDIQLHDPIFRETFMVFATPKATSIRFLSDAMQAALVAYRQQVGKAIYMAIVESEIYIAVTMPKNLLEPHLWRSNVSFELVREFYQDLNLLLQIIEDFDAHN